MLTTIFFLIELVGGYFASSLAIMTDAAHLFSDISGFIISIIAVYLAHWPANSKLTFGFLRTEAIASFVSLFFIWSLTAVLIFFDFVRLFNTSSVDGPLMLTLGITGLFINIGLIMVLCRGKCSSAHWGHHGNVADDDDHFGSSHCHDEENPALEYRAIARNNEHGDKGGSSTKRSTSNNNNLLNLWKVLIGSSAEIEWMVVRAAYIHALCDMLQNVGVIVAGAIISINPRLTFADPLCTLFFAVMVVSTTYGLARDTLMVLMEWTPQSITTDRVHQKLLRADGVCEVSNLHIWSISPKLPALMLHVSVATDVSPANVLKQIHGLLVTKFGIAKSTIQIDVLTKCWKWKVCSTSLKSIRNMWVDYCSPLSIGGHRQNVYVRHSFSWIANQKVLFLLVTHFLKKCNTCLWKWQWLLNIEVHFQNLAIMFSSTGDTINSY